MNKKQFFRNIFAIAVIPFSYFFCGTSITQSPDQSLLDKIKLPKGFSIEYYASEIENARSMAYSDKGILFVGTRNEGSVYAIIDVNRDFSGDKKIEIAREMNMPNGVALDNGDLYVAEVSRILKFPDILDQILNGKEDNFNFEVIFDDFPEETHHGWKYIDFGPDGKLYVPVGAPCNICEPEKEIFATITRMDKDGSGFEIVHKGIRNTVGMTWHPTTGELWFTDNGGDNLGDNRPACELNHANEDDMDFGYPYCHQGDLPDPDFGKKHKCSEFTPPAIKLGPHVAPLGLEFYTGDQFPDEYQNQLLIAEHGSWNRSNKIGYRITLVNIEDSRATNYTTFAEGWLEGETTLGRPVDLEILPDGSLLVSDDYHDAIYRIRYDRK
ncbi:PQQ-dependent sugar dehydrogenase [Membranihabitans maritimus]|uniref:PQQ-dependent sugar dehydrogenase n=1 Tax=Membranihabitans maritimus TaxID=2904244 RepID=UPI001F434ACA|nr:PQQ-dependent sugar dehydrogenase [Membranihabitans maritimus]